MAQDRKIPVLLDTSCGLTLSQADDIMEGFPDLTAILFYNNVWPCDRFLYPFLKRYPNLMLDTTHLVADRVYEKAVGIYGASRLIHGSGFPYGYMGVNMLTILHSDLSEDEKSAIACGNIQKLIREADFT
jgi:predicted TIM-barrel fold metal-dependent hydrolase